MRQHHIELLAPARTADIGIEAFNHGADAVYIGGPSFGARTAADNSVSDLGRLAAHAHRFGGVRILKILKIESPHSLESNKVDFVSRISSVRLKSE